MSTALDAIRTALSGSVLNQEETSLFSRYYLGGGAGGFNPDGSVNLDYYAAPGTTIRADLTRILDPADKTGNRDWYAQFGTPQLYREVAAGMNVVPGLSLTETGQLQLQPTAIRSQAPAPSSGGTGGLFALAALAWFAMRRR